jgi:transcription termination/antitermination protein NusG
MDVPRFKMWFTCGTAFAVAWTKNMTPGNDLSWVALQVRPRSEKLVTNALNSKGIEVFLPLYTTRRRWSDRVKELELPLFDGYVMCRLDLQYRLPALTIPGVIQFVGFGRQPVPIDAAEIAALQAVVKSGLPSAPWPFLQVGQRIRVEHGPLRDLEGILLQVKGTQRLILSVSLLQRSVAVEVDRDCVRPVLSYNRLPKSAVLAATSCN